MTAARHSAFYWWDFVQPFATVPVRVSGQLLKDGYKVVAQPNGPVETAPEFLTSEKTRARQKGYKAKETAKKLAQRVNANSNIGYSDQAGSDRTAAIRGRA